MIETMRTLHADKYDEGFIEAILKRRTEFDPVTAQNQSQADTPATSSFI